MGGVSGAAGGIIEDLAAPARRDLTRANLRFARLVQKRPGISDPSPRRAGIGPRRFQILPIVALPRVQGGALNVLFPTLNRRNTSG
jgi:hypothetical protein